MIIKASPEFPEANTSIIHELVLLEHPREDRVWRSPVQPVLLGKFTMLVT